MNHPSSSFFECSGPATEALESSLKRRRTPDRFSDLALDAVFDFGSVFDSIDDEKSESFPSLAWPVDEENEISILPPQMMSRKRIRSDIHSGLKRSKAFSGDLSALDASATTTTLPLNKLSLLAEHKLPLHSRHQPPFAPIVSPVNMARCC
jgi:hypothetical protein